MVTYVAGAGARLYPVEVSGWDSGQNCFVEKCELVWSEESGKHVCLTQELREKAILPDGVPLRNDTVTRIEMAEGNKRSALKRSKRTRRGQLLSQLFLSH